MYRPAGELNEVGGDFYDAFELEDGWMVAIGDVVGRGPAAASLTALARYTLRTAGMVSGDPRVALSLLNDALRGRPELSPCTVGILVLPRAAGPDAEVTIACAGHPLPLLVRDGHVAEAGTPGPLLGAFDVKDWPLERIAVVPGDQLVIYTDGVIEARGVHDRFGEERLRTALAGVAGPIRAIGRIEAALESFIRGEPDDDAAMIAIQRVGGGAGAEGATTGAAMLA